ncbi:ribonuclease P protein component [Helicobacter turcicus]|uniref:Ribonuclease P protein component n=1 Tax=Helicobacter turcicus TaxID=2867412 RepID=A0ABS7JLT2_9HELI|nr:ribonuclease P protein component [Helicobacter turcicus]MBX7490343.1 ribonuclease P protein component [Helicobacter turcicus]MBX7545078.1 ribonuclease P protein component [Helicobacter turcicus]
MVTLNTKQDFDRVYKSQKRWHNSHFILFFREDARQRRVGFSVSKRVGNAVRRNRIKRRLRAIYRESMLDLRGGDMVLLAKDGLDKVVYKTLQNSYKYALIRLDLV